MTGDGTSGSKSGAWERNAQKDREFDLLLGSRIPSTSITSHPNKHDDPTNKSFTTKMVSSQPKFTSALPTQPASEEQNNRTTTTQRQRNNGAVEGAQSTHETSDR